MVGPSSEPTEVGQVNGTNGASNNLSTTTNQPLSADEIALYDRQIRLWGAQAQERIRSAHILLVSLRALGTEIAKNLTLAGINSLTIIDDDLVTEDDLGAQYFLREEDIGKPRAKSAIPRIQELNPRVTVKSDGSLSDLLGKDITYYAPFDCVIACDHGFNILSAINTAVRLNNRPFYAAGIHGFYGFIFADLVGHEFVVERDKSNVVTNIGAETTTRSVVSVSSKRENNGKTVEVVKKQELYCPLLLANSSQLPSDVLGNRRKLRAVPALLPCLRAVFDFQREFNRLPGHTNDELRAFTTLATTKASELELPPETLRAEFLRSFIQNLGAEMVPTAAFVGGRLSEDVINVLGKREQPIQNFALFDGDGLEGRIYSLYSTPPERAMAAGMGGIGLMMNGVADVSNGTGAVGDGMGNLGNGMSGMTNNIGNGMSIMMGATGGIGNGVGTSMGNGMMPPNPGFDLTNAYIPTDGVASGYTPDLSQVPGFGASATMFPVAPLDPQDVAQDVTSGVNNAGPTSAPANADDAVMGEGKQHEVKAKECLQH